MMSNDLKHIAVVQADSEAALIKKINDAVDEYGLSLIHYEISSGINKKDPFKNVWTAELFFQGPMVFDYSFDEDEDFFQNIPNTDVKTR